MALSYTDMAVDANIVRTAAPMTKDQIVEQWMLNLPPARRQVIEQRLARLVAALPEWDKLQLHRYMVSKHETSPVPLGVDGLGCVRCGKPGCMGGLGQWGSLVTGLVQVGGGIWSAQENKDLQKDLARNALRSDERIASIQAEAALEAHRILASATVETARQGRDGLIAVAQTGAPIYQKLAIGGAAIAALAGVGLFLVLRKKKK